MVLTTGGEGLGSATPGASSNVVHFIHIPKTGGHTLEAILERQYGGAALFFSRWGREYEGPRGRAIGVFLKSVEASLPGKVYHPELLEDVAGRFLALSAEGRQATRVIWGKNLEWGLDDLLPVTLDTFTILRDPVDRVLSQYFFTVDYASKPAQVSLYEHIAAHVQPNMQTLLMSGPHGLDPQPEAEVMLARAKENLRSCQVFGMTEQFGESVLLLARAFGWNEVRYERRKVNRTRPRMTDIPRDVILRLAADNELDVALYRYAQGLFKNQLEAYGPELEKDMVDLGKRNVLFRSRESAKRRGALRQPPGATPYG